MVAADAEWVSCSAVVIAQAGTMWSFNWFVDAGAFPSPDSAAGAALATDSFGTAPRSDVTVLNLTAQILDAHMQSVVWTPVAYVFSRSGRHELTISVRGAGGVSAALAYTTPVISVMEMSPTPSSTSTPSSSQTASTSASQTGSASSSATASFSPAATSSPSSTPFRCTTEDFESGNTEGFVVAPAGALSVRDYVNSLRAGSPIHPASGSHFAYLTSSLAGAATMYRDIEVMAGSVFSVRLLVDSTALAPSESLSNNAVVVDVLLSSPNGSVISSTLITSVTAAQLFSNYTGQTPWLYYEVVLALSGLHRLQFMVRSSSSGEQFALAVDSFSVCQRLPSRTSAATATSSATATRSLTASHSRTPSRSASATRSPSVTPTLSALPRIAAFAPGATLPVMVLRVGNSVSRAEPLRGVAQPLFLDLYPTRNASYSAPDRARPMHTVMLPSTGRSACTLAVDAYSPTSGSTAFNFDLEGRATRSEDGVMVHLPCYALRAGAPVTFLSPRAIATIRMDGSVSVTSSITYSSEGPAMIKSIAAVASSRGGGSFYVAGESYRDAGVRFLASPAALTSQILTMTAENDGGRSVGIGSVRALHVMGSRLIVSEANLMYGSSALYSCTSWNSQQLPAGGDDEAVCQLLRGTETFLDPALDEPGGAYSFVFESASVLWTTTVEMVDGPSGRTPKSVFNRYELRSALDSRWLRTRSIVVSEATMWSLGSRETVRWPVYSITGRMESSRRFVLYGVSRKALFRVDPYAAAAAGLPIRPEVLAYSRPGTAFRSVSFYGGVARECGWGLPAHV